MMIIYTNKDNTFLQIYSSIYQIYSTFHNTISLLLHTYSIYRNIYSIYHNTYFPLLHIKSILRRIYSLLFHTKYILRQINSPLFQTKLCLNYHLMNSDELQSVSFNQQGISDGRIGSCNLHREISAWPNERNSVV